VTFAITNTGQDLLPVSLGAHPAFNWPLLPGLPKEAYGIRFAHDENEPVGRLRGGLLLSEREPTPIKDSFLHLSESLFTNDAIILTHPSSTAVRFAADRGPAIDVSWQGFRELGIWSKPGGAPFLCIEPWHGFASPTDFDGEFSDKPGLMKIACGKTELLKYRIKLG
jgi:galactose mutarotase-like enzyme